jgi:hypothetical protein
LREHSDLSAWSVRKLEKGESSVSCSDIFCAASGCKLPGVFCFLSLIK